MSTLLFWVRAEHSERKVFKSENFANCGLETSTNIIYVDQRFESKNFDVRVQTYIPVITFFFFGIKFLNVLELLFILPYLRKAQTRLGKINHLPHDEYHKRVCDVTTTSQWKIFLEFASVDGGKRFCAQKNHHATRQISKILFLFRLE